MNANRRAIVHLIALGRVTPAEAERLLLACDDGLAELWAAVACCLFLGLVLPHAAHLAGKLLHLAHALVPWLFTVLQHALSLLTHLPGGTL